MSMSSMTISPMTIATALAILSLGMLVSGGALAGGSSSAPSKYNNASQTVSVDQTRYLRRVRSVHFTITEFSSSSARTSVPKR